jgi:hypothetical protein
MRSRGKSLHVLNEATRDAGYELLRPGRDLPMLLAFLERFDRLGWLPPTDVEKRRLLAAHDVIMYAVRDDLSFYEFRSKGGRGERDPWLTIFFHVAADSRVRICGIELTKQVNRRRAIVIERMRMRVEVLDEWLKWRERK